MDTPLPAYNLAPAARLLLLGVMLALAPLAWAWARGGPSPLQRLATLSWITVFLCFDLVLFGAFTRLTDSGLGCPDWPGCYGQLSPWGAKADISAAQAAHPTGPVTHAKAWIEMLHRYFATGVGALIAAVALSAWHRRVRAVVHPALASFTLLWVCVVGAFGALTVSLRLAPAVVTAHLLGALVLLALLLVQAQRYARAAADVAAANNATAGDADLAPRRAGHSLTLFARPGTLPRSMVRVLWLGLGLVFVQAALGAWVSANYAVLACTDFPTCQGQWWPPMDFSQGFTLWRPLGFTAQRELISFEALVAIHYSHRLMAYVVLLVLGALALALWRHGRKRQAQGLLALLVWQVGSGVSNVVLGWPLVAALAHTAGAAALVLLLVWALSTANQQPFAATNNATSAERL